MGGDGQVTLDDMVVKGGARKVRTVADGRVLTGFAGASADAMTLLERFETKLDEYRGNLPRAAAELAKEWRMDRALRRLEALLVVADENVSLLVSGSGDVIEPDDGVITIGSGGPMALSAARALLRETTLGAGDIVEKSLRIASEICVFTNERIEVLELDGESGE